MLYPEDILKPKGNNAPGVRPVAYLAALEWFDTIASPTSAGVMGDSTLITSAHTFLPLPTPSPAPSPMPSPLPTYGFIQVETTIATGVLNINQVGSPDNWGIEHTFEAKIPGAAAAMFEFMAQNGEFILLVGMPDCTSTTYHQVGTKCDPCFSDGIEWTSGTKGSTDPRGFTLKLKAYGTTPLLYSGAVNGPGTWATP